MSMYRDYDEDEKPKKVEESYDLSVLKSGSVTEITLGDKKFEVIDPNRIEQSLKLISQMNESLYSLRQRIKELSQSNNQLVEEINKLKSEVQKLKDNSNNYGSSEYYNPPRY